MLSGLKSLVPPNWLPYVDAEDLCWELLDGLVEHSKEPVYPPRDLLFSALRLTPPESVKVVILGQDPYHGPGEAHGLAFSVRAGTPLPPSLRNIFKELEQDIGLRRSVTDLSDWAAQGVLLLNASLTVAEGKPSSHADCGWAEITDSLVRNLSRRQNNLAFVLWGAFARRKKSLLDGEHLLIESAHPSPLSADRGFFGSKPFSKVNAYLKETGRAPVKWV